MITSNNSTNGFNHDCAFAETLVAVLYDEATARERLEFERHAVNCQSCRQELIEFGALKNSLGEYRETILQTAAAPEIMLPPIAVSAPVKKSTFTNLRELLFAPNNLWQTATALAAFLICAALVFVLASGNLQSPDDRQIVQSNLKTPPVEKTVEPKVADKSAQTVVSPTSQLTKTAAPKVSAANAPENKLTEKSAARSSAPAPVRAKTVLPAAKPRGQQPESAQPRLDLEFDDAAEDESLRLSDLLDEVGSVE